MKKDNMKKETKNEFVRRQRTAYKKICEGLNILASISKMAKDGVEDVGSIECDVNLKFNATYFKRADVLTPNEIEISFSNLSIGEITNDGSEKYIYIGTPMYIFSTDGISSSYIEGKYEGDPNTTSVETEGGELSEL